MGVGLGLDLVEREEDGWEESSRFEEREIWSKGREEEGSVAESFFSVDSLGSSRELEDLDVG